VWVRADDQHGRESDVKNFVFPKDGWKADGSVSYGTSELFKGIPRVLVRLFPAEEEQAARATFEFLVGAGLTQAHIEEVTHRTDGKVYYYVFAEDAEFRDLCRTRDLGVDLPASAQRRAPRGPLAFGLVALASVLVLLMLIYLFR
jgi:hypothetical protein